jgi:hypothetical protein
MRKKRKINMPNPNDLNIDPNKYKDFLKAFQQSQQEPEQPQPMTDQDHLAKIQALRDMMTAKGQR